MRVEVANGVATFDGAIIDERLRSGLKVIAENTPACVAVRDHMCWIEPNSGSFCPRKKTSERLSRRLQRVQAARKKATERTA